MAAPLPPIPDPVPLREALRGLKHVLRSGRAAMERALPLDQLPAPAARLTRSALAAGDTIARGVDEAASHVLRRLFGQGAPEHTSLDSLAAQGPAAAADFGGFCYAGLALILDRLGVERGFISETAARQAWLSTVSEHPRATLPELAAALHLALRDRRVLRDLDPDARGSLQPDELLPLPIFTVLAWLLDGPQPAVTAGDALGQSRILERCRLLAQSIVAADSVRNQTRLAQLFAQFQQPATR